MTVSVCYIDLFPAQSAIGDAQVEQDHIDRTVIIGRTLQYFGVFGQAFFSYQSAEASSHPLPADRHLRR
jgi:hypothetical protein